MVVASLGKPEWLKIKAFTPEHKAEFASHQKIKNAVHSRGLTTVCEESHCPNIPECWANEGTATFMVMGDTCTRGCRFCQVNASGKGKPLDPEEPRKLAEAIAEMGLDYAVITSVDRDDLPDQGASHFADCVREVKKRDSSILVEVLTPDFQGNTELVQRVLDAKPDVYAHNLETVERLQGVIRDKRANYAQSISVLEFAKKASPETFTKTSLILGFGETEEELVKAFKDARFAGVDILTMGQYLRPSSWHLPVQEYVAPEKFARYKELAEREGFLFVASGPFVRSSYKAGELFVKNVLRKARA